MSKNLDYSFLDCAKNMPPLKHKVGDDFDICKSEVIHWLANQPTIMQKIMEMAKNKKVIVYDAKSRTWKGVDT